MTMNGVVASNKQLSGENEQDYWNRMMNEFQLREGSRFKFELAYEYLKDKPKWTVYCEHVKNTDVKWRPRPKGSKMAKRVESEKARIARVVQDLTADESANNQPPSFMQLAAERQKQILESIEKTNDAMYQFGLMMTAGTLSPSRKASAMALAAAELEAKQLANEEKKMALAERRLALRREEMLVRSQEASMGRESPSTSVAAMPANPFPVDSDSDNDFDTPYDVTYKNTEE
jgi:hypothetical protein